MHSAGENRSTNSHLSISDVRRTTLTLIALSTMLLIFASLAQAQTETLFRGASSVQARTAPRLFQKDTWSRPLAISIHLVCRASRRVIANWQMVECNTQMAP